MADGDRPAALTDGERWVREELDRLRTRRFSARALVEFVGASLARSRHTRARRPALVAQSRRWGAAGLAAALGRGPAHAAWWLGCWIMLDWHLGMAETAGGLARPLRSADALTLARLWTAPVVRRDPAPHVIAAASATDLLDGLLARHSGPTRLGRDLDSVADATFFHAALAALVDHGRLGAWVLTAERGRLLTAGARMTMRYFAASERPANPEQRAVAAVLAAAGALLAAATPDARAGAAHPARARLAEALVAAAIGARAVQR